MTTPANEAPAESLEVTPRPDRETAEEWAFTVYDRDADLALDCIVKKREAFRDPEVSKWWKNPDGMAHEALRWAINRARDMARVAIAEKLRFEASEAAGIEFADFVVEVGALYREVARAYGEPVGLAHHDVAKRLYRMGYRKVAPAELGRCRRCGRDRVVTSQSVCLECIGKPAGR
jgi:hypothetical protein